MSDPRSISVVEHLEELRMRILRCLLYVVIGSAVAWKFRTDLMDALQYPAFEGASRAGLQDFTFHIFDPVGGIILMMQVALLGGVILAAVGIIIEGWLFIAPALTPAERRYAFVVIPAAMLLFASGIWFCYIATPAAFAFLIRFNVTLGVEPQFILNQYLTFFSRMLLGFGLTFEMPLVITFLVRVGLMSSAALLRSWRWAIVIIIVIAALVTPTPDPFNMTVLALPMLALYFFSVGIAILIERRRDRVQAASGVARARAPLEAAGCASCRPTDIATNVEHSSDGNDSAANSNVSPASDVPKSDE